MTTLRIRKAELAIASLRLEFMEFWANHVRDHPGHVSPMDVRTAIRDLGIAEQEVEIAKARLEAEEAIVMYQAYRSTRSVPQ